MTVGARRQRPEAPATARRQRGVVLFIALIVMVAMTFAGIALVRSMDTTGQAIGNLVLRQSSVLPSNLAVEAAAASLFPDASRGGPMVADPTRDEPSLNYLATYRRSDDAYGVPASLQRSAAARSLPVQLADDAGHAMTYVVERMCDDAHPARPVDGSPSEAWCDMMPPAAAGSVPSTPPPGAASRDPVYRVTVRVDGPKGTTTFVQAALGVRRSPAGSAPATGATSRRLSWRVLGR